MMALWSDLFHENIFIQWFSLRKRKMSHTQYLRSPSLFRYLEGSLQKCAYKNYSEYMQQIYRRTPMPKCDFNFIEITLWYGFFPVNLLHIFRTSFYKKTYVGLLHCCSATFNFVSRVEKNHEVNPRRVFGRKKFWW